MRNWNWKQKTVFKLIASICYQPDSVDYCLDADRLYACIKKYWNNKRKQ